MDEFNDGAGPQMRAGKKCDIYCVGGELVDDKMSEDSDGRGEWCGSEDAYEHGHN